MISLLPFGLKNGKLVSIHEVESGLNCESECPSCRGKLVARKGKIKAHHFAHHHEGNCVGAVETALHLAAKEILERRKIVVLPELIHFDDKYSKDFLVLAKSMEIKLDSVQLEETVGSFKPDIIGLIGKTELYIEIAVTHFVDGKKESKVREKGVSMIEIYLGELKDGFTYQELEENVIYTTHNKSWIYNAKQERLLAKQLKPIKEKHQRKKAEKAKRKKEKAEKRREEDRIEQIESEKRKKEQKIFEDKVKEIESEGNKVQWLDQHRCLHLLKLEANKYRNNEFIAALRKGEFWNGEFYGNPPFGSYIYLNNQIKYIFPPDREFFLTDEEHALRKKIYGQLMRINRDSTIRKGSCFKCEHFIGYVDHNEDCVICKKE